MSEAAIKSFKSNYDQLVSGATGEVPESDIAPVEALPVLSSLRGEWHEVCALCRNVKDDPWLPAPVKA